MKRLAAIAVNFGLLAALALGADVNGKWKASIPTQDGSVVEAVFELKAEGETLTGTTSGALGEGQISDGKVSGDEVSFSTTGGDKTLVYRGKIVNDEIRMTVQEGERSIEITAKRS